MDKNSKPAVISAESYERIILHSCRHANTGIPEDEWKMVYGLLSGYSNDKFLFVKNVHPIAVGSATEVSVGEQEFLKTQEIFDKREEYGLENSVEMLTDIIETDKDNAKRKSAVKFLGGIIKYIPKFVKNQILDNSNLVAIKIFSAEPKGVNVEARLIHIVIPKRNGAGFTRIF